MFDFLKKLRDRNPQGGSGKRKHKNRDGILGGNSHEASLFRKSLVFFLTGAAVFIVVFVLFEAVSILLILFSGVLFSIMATSLSDFLERRVGGSHRVAVTIVLSFLLLAVFLVFRFIMPPVVGEIQSLSGKMVESVRSLRAWLGNVSGGAFFIRGIETLENTVLSPETWRRIGGIFSSTFGAFSIFVLILWIGVYLSYDPAKYRNGAIRLVPPRYRGRAAEVVDTMGYTLRKWLIAQFISMAVVTIATGIAFILIGVPLPFALALLTGILNFIPYLGPLLALVPIVLLAFLNSPLTALYTFIIFQMIQMIEGNILLPLIYQKTVRIPAVLTIMSQLLFGTLLGLPGIVLAAPLAIIGTVAVKMLYLEDILGEPPGNTDTMR